MENRRKEYLYSDITHQIIGAVMEVHRVLGSGFLESVYQEALAHDFRSRNIKFLSQVLLSVTYKDLTLNKTFIVDYLVDEHILVEIKAQKELSELDKSQVVNYLKASGKEVGLLVNFGEKSLNWKRFVHNKLKEQATENHNNKIPGKGEPPHE